MANNPETRFIQSIHRRLKALPEPPIIRKLADRFTQGWPDVLYIGPTGICLWVEYKIHPNKPTPLQLETLNMLRSFKQNAVTITKAPTTCLIHNGTTEESHTEPWAWITKHLGYPDHATTQTRRTKRCGMDP